MKSKSILNSFIYFILLILITSCNKDKDEPVQNIGLTTESATDITKTSFKIKWSINNTDYDKLLIEVSLSESFDVLDKEIDVTNNQQTVQVIDHLSGATKYYYRMKVNLKDGNSSFSLTKSATTSYDSETVTFITSDGINIAGKMKYLDDPRNAKPGIIFMHELGIWVNNWENADVVTSLISQGYVCLIFDFRGHGDSDDYSLPTEHSQVEQYINEASRDLVAAIEFMKLQERVDSDRLALVGGSLGGIMAIAGNGYPEVKTTVSLSASQLGIYSIFPGLEINSAFFIAGELDINQTNFPEAAAKMYNNATEPKKLKIIPSNSAHGTDLLIVNGLNQEISDWINGNINK